MSNLQCLAQKECPVNPQVGCNSAKDVIIKVEALALRRGADFPQFDVTYVPAVLIVSSCPRKTFQSSVICRSEGSLDLYHQSKRCPARCFSAREAHQEDILERLLLTLQFIIGPGPAQGGSSNE